MQAMSENAWRFETPEQLWRCSQQWLGAGYEDEGQWMHEMAVDLIEIRELPTVGQPRAQQQEQQAQPMSPLVAEAMRILQGDPDDDIPF